jgi:hypothetical protein
MDWGEQQLTPEIIMNLMYVNKLVTVVYWCGNICTSFVHRISIPLSSYWPCCLTDLNRISVVVSERNSVNMSGDVLEASSFCTCRQDSKF